MDKMVLTLFLGTMQVTSYRSVPNQTDDSPYYTSIGEHVNCHGIAVSRDLLKRWGGPLNYGDAVYVEGYGLKIVNDVMGAKSIKALDIWVETANEEKKIGVKHKRVWVLKLDKEIMCHNIKRK